MDGSVLARRITSTSVRHTDPGKLQLVIVALPSENDYVRKVSSEKEPHLTLLYLGETEFDSAQLDHVVEYVGHAASQLTCFALDVERRGALGDQNADVLFFNKRWAKNVSGFRDRLLQDPLISAAYHSTDQFDEWTPHLTMGYPESPAKTNTKEYQDFTYVNFDRIAVWTGAYSGPTFQLKTYDYDMEVAMSQIRPPHSVVDGILKHYGVKGMRWGVRRSQAQLDSASGRTVSADAKIADAAQAKVNAGGTRALSNHELQGLINRMNLERQYSSMQVQRQSELERGLQTTQKILKVGKTVEDVRRFLDTPTGKAVKTGLKGAWIASRVAAAAHTGGASAAAGAAASAGAGLVVRRMNR